MRIGKSELYAICFGALFLLGACLRFTGRTRGESHFVLSDHASAGLSTSFHHFHPNEEFLVQAALAPIDPVVPPYTAYGLLPYYVLR